MKTWAWAVVVLGVAASAWGQTRDGGLDGGDGALGMQPAPKEETPESEETAAEGAPCLDARQCDRGLACKSGRCVPSAPRVVPACGGAPAVVMLAALGLVLAQRRRS